jgi:tetratricopeptide (TPR) repeat protein
MEIEKVITLIKDHKFEESIKFLNLLILKNKDNLTALHLRGICHLKLSNYKDAKEDFNRSIILNPSFPEVYNNLGYLYFINGQNELSVKNFSKAIELKNNFKRAIFGLIKVLSHTKNPQGQSVFISKHNELNKIKFNYSENEYIKNENIKDLVIRVNKIIQDEFQNLDLNSTQIYRRTNVDLECARHKKIFNTYNVIPEFCFGCYKVQIEIDNVLDLIKLYIIFDNINFENNNTKKCLIEIRPKIPGRYKGLIYCSSFEESNIIKDKMLELTKKNLNKKIVCKVKKGCTEYGIKYPDYSKLDRDSMAYKPEWIKYESIIDKRFPELIMDKKITSSIKGISLNDVLIIQNWLAYAKLIGDKTYKEISDQDFKSIFLEKKLKVN